MTTPDPSILALRDKIKTLSIGHQTRPVLVYFDIIGIAWPIRCLLHLAQVDYELIQISIREWSAVSEDGTPILKPCFPNGHVPLYVDQDVYLNQSNVILTYLADKYGLMPVAPAEKIAAQEIMSHAYDALFHWNGLLQIMIRRGIPEEQVTARLDAFMGHGDWGLTGNGYRNHLDGFSRYLAANRQASGFMVSDALTVADLHAFNVLCNWYKAFDREAFVQHYPDLDDYLRRIAVIPGVRDYIDNHQEPTVWFNLPKIAIRLTSPQELEGLTG